MTLFIIVLAITILWFVICSLPEHRNNVIDKHTKLDVIRQELENFAKNFDDKTLYNALKDRIIALLSKNPEVETNTYSAHKIAYTMLANISNALFIRHRIYPTDTQEQSLVQIWKRAVEKLYSLNEISEEEYKNTLSHIKETVSVHIGRHKSAFEDDRDDMINNPLFSGQWWF